jgi:RNA polymerase sigma-70 factor (ECF subfamily)
MTDSKDKRFSFFADTHENENKKINTMDNFETWKNLYGKLHLYLLRNLKDKEIAKDILQDVFLKILEKKESLKNNENYEGWIFRITKNLLIDYYRKSKKVVELQFSAKNNEFEKEEFDIFEKLSPALEEFIKKLPPKYREPLLLSDIKGLNQKSIAEKLNLSVSGAKSRIQRARKLLKESFFECSTYKFDSLGSVADFQPKSNSCVCGKC